MALPEQIAVKYTEEEAEYLSVRPVVRQTFTLHELVDMVLGVTGKDLGRVQQILRIGTVAFNYYRYWWTGFEAGADELAALLEKFPDADPGRAFRAEECAALLLAGKRYQPAHSASFPPLRSGQAPGCVALPANGIELGREEAARKRLFSGRSFWDALTELTRERAPSYLGYSYQRRADVYLLEIAPEQAARLAREAEKLASRSVRALTAQIAAAASIFFLCPRSS